MLLSQFSPLRDITLVSFVYVTHVVLFCSFIVNLVIRLVILACLFLSAIALFLSLLLLPFVLDTLLVLCNSFGLLLIIILVNSFILFWLINWTYTEFIFCPLLLATLFTCAARSHTVPLSL